MLREPTATTRCRLCRGIASTKAPAIRPGASTPHRSGGASIGLGVRAVGNTAEKSITVGMLPRPGVPAGRDRCGDFHQTRVWTTGQWSYLGGGDLVGSRASGSNGVGGGPVSRRRRRLQDAGDRADGGPPLTPVRHPLLGLSLIHISEPTR